MRKSHWIGGALVVLLVLILSLTVDPLGLMTQEIEEPDVGVDVSTEDLGAGGLRGRGKVSLPGADPKTWEGDPVGRRVLSLGKAELEGLVTANDQPLRFARVQVALPPPHRMLGVRTRKDGTWAIAGLPDGAHLVRASASDYRGRTMAAPPVLGEQKATVPPIELTARPENKNGITVKVTDGFNRPLPGARVLATTMPWDIHLAMGPERVGMPHVASKRGTTDENGRVTLGPLDPDDYAVVAMAPGYINASVDNVVVSGNRIRSIGMRLVEGVSVRGRVLGADGNGIEDALVMGFAQPSFSASQTVRSEADGSFVLSGLRKGGYMFIAWHETSGQTMQPGASPGSVDIKLAGTGKIRGAVVTKDGKPITDGRVRPIKVGPFAYVYSMVKDLDESGIFEVEVPAGEWNCRVQSSDGWVSDGNMASVTAGDTTKIKIVVEESRVVRGVVMDANGNHIEGAEIFVMQGGFPETPSREQYSRSDADGRFEVPGLTSESVDLHVVHSEYADTKVSVNPASSATAAEVSVRLTAGASVAGRVTDSEGKGIAGEQVNIAMGWFDGRSVYTDDAGGYRFDAVKAGEYTVTTGPFEQGARGLSKKGVQVGEEGLVTVDFQNPAAGGALTGTVTMAGKPVAGAKVTVTDARGADRAVGVTTDEAGAFRAEGLQFGSVRISVKTADGRTGSARTSLSETGGIPVVDVDIGTATVSARVLGPTGEPAPGCWINVENVMSEDAGWGRIVDNGNSDGEGVFRSDGLQPGRYTLRVMRTEFAQYVSPPFDLREGEAKNLGDIRMTAGVVLRGVVRDDAGRPVERATVSLKDLKGNALQMFSMATSGSDGLYEMHGIEPGRFIAHVQAAGHAHADKEVVITEQGGSLDAVLERGGTVRITVLDPGGDPVARANVKLFDQQGLQVTRTISLANFDTGSRRTGADGRTSLDDLAAGIYVVRAELAGWTLVGSPPRTRLEPGGEVSVTLTLEKAP
ncbi:MAG: carboxypeptidase-like regulatory domain-containing protein [Planctomycetota bacterium]|nr:carboxypeptidase-like regulatory domain-containing protein [Planctomycetota bacterium]